MLFKRWQANFLVFLTIIVIIIPLKYFNSLEPLELGTLDRLFQLRSSEPRDERIVIVGINESDIQKYKTYPFNDRFLANLLNKIRIQKPIAIGLDIARDVPVPPGTEELNKVFETTPNLIGVGQINSYVDIDFPPILKAKGQIGDISGTVDSDRVVRRGILYPLQDGSKESEIPALSVAMAYKYLETKGIEAVGSEKDNWLQLKDTIFYPYKQSEGNYQILINWRKNFPRLISVADVLEGKVPADFFQNKLVFLGGTAPSTKDIFFTPFGQRYGVEIQATMTSLVISSVLDGRGLIRGMESPQDYIYLAFWVIVGSIAVRWGKIHLVLLVALGAIVILSLVAYIAFTGYHWWLPLAYPVAAIVIGTIGSIVYIYIGDLRNAKAVLESQVRVRTLELSEKNRELAKTLEELKQIQQELVTKEKLASLGILTAGLAHEIRNPLYGVNLKIFLLREAEEKITDVIKEHELYLDDFDNLLPISKSNLSLINRELNALNGEVQRANLIIDNILDYARREISSPISTNINSLITEARSAVQQVKQEELEVEITLNLSENLEEILIIKEELKRAFINLIENAWNTLIDKNEIVENFEPQIAITTERSENNILVKIKDNGLGIVEEDKSNIVTTQA